LKPSSFYIGTWEKMFVKNYISKAIKNFEDETPSNTSISAPVNNESASLEKYTRHHYLAYHISMHQGKKRGIPNPPKNNDGKSATAGGIVVH
jgi:hypothetical protein